MEQRAAAASAAWCGWQTESQRPAAAAGRRHSGSVWRLESTPRLPARPREGPEGAGALPAVGEGPLRRTGEWLTLARGTGRELPAPGCPEGALGPGAVAHRPDSAH